MEPIAIPQTVIPTCTVLMNRTGSSIKRSARRAGSEFICSRRPRRAVTSAYSAATKIAFASTSTSTRVTRRKSLMPRSPGPGY